MQGRQGRRLHWTGNTIMNNKAKTIRALLSALLAAMLATSGVLTIMTAVDLPFGRAAMTGAALAGAWLSALCGLAALSGAGMASATALFAVSVGIWSLSNARRFSALGLFFGLWQGQQADSAAAAQGGALFFMLLAALLGVVFFALLYKREMTSLAVMLMVAIAVASHAMSETTSLIAVVPGLAASASAFALTGGVQRDAGAPRVLIPSVLAVALALMLVPVGRVTWRPLEEAGERVRSMFEQYFSFTHERVAFSISEKGFDHGGEVGGETVIMLGGPAQPDDKPVMRVSASGEALLRGTIRTAYTGYSWVDTVPKNRYLYFDLTHRTVRDRVFDLNGDSPDGAFRPLEADVEFLSAGTSTLFVPGRLERFSMDLSNAVYYNSAGEMFMAREVAAGDAYSAQALAPVYGEALRQATYRGESAADDRYDGIYAAHTALPPGVDTELYNLTIRLTQDAPCAYDRAEAIAGYLRRNMRYRLDVDYPPLGRDFVSWFVLDSKVGYCSYFASAMAVMGRIAGLPTRYVEGYLARTDGGDSVTLTGQDAHAWAEIYFRGIGWVPFDATNGAPGFGDGAGGEGDGGNDADDGGAPDADEGEQPPAPDEGEAQGGGQPEATPTPEPDSGDQPDPPANGSPLADEPPAEADDDAGRSGRSVLWRLLGGLLLILLVALAVMWVRARLKASDPVRLCGQSRRLSQAAMIAYRANLTLLSHIGQGPVNGETPEAFADRVSETLHNPEFSKFARAVSQNRYGGRPLRRDDLAAGLSAYRAFEDGLSRVERLHYTVRRVFRGLGDFEQIP